MTPPKVESKILLLRHDIDADMEAALEIAYIEHELQIKSTYFFMIQSPIYNLFSRRNMEIVREISTLSHEIALHSDVCFKFDVKEEISSFVRKEIVVLEKLIDKKVFSVSYHQPRKNALVQNSDFIEEGFISAYTDVQIKPLKYVSDSNREMSVKEIADSCKDGVLSSRSLGVHLLIHPMWWIYEQPTTNLVWNEVIKENFYSSQKQLLSTERAFGDQRSLELS